MTADGGPREPVYWHRLRRMTLCEWSLRDQRTFTGFLWTLLYPALMFLVLYLLFTRWMGKFAPKYHFFLLIGLLQYSFFANCTTYASSVLRRRGALLANFSLPLELPVLSAGLSVALSHLIEMLLLIALLLAFERAPAWGWLWLVPIEAVLIALSLATACIVAWFGALYRDVERIWSILTTAGFFLTPIFYTLAVIDPQRRAVLRLNPMTRVIEMSRSALIGPEGGYLDLLPLIALAAVLAAAGWTLLRRCSGPVRDAAWRA